MPTVLRIAGNRFFFFSNEGAEPPHVHVETAEKYAKFWLGPVAVVRSVGYNPRELRRLRDLVTEHEAYLMERWDEFFQSA